MKLPPQSKYPTEIFIKGESWRITFVDVIEGKDTLGLCDPNNKVIHIRRGLKKDELFKTFIHELCHAAEDSYSIKVSHKAVYKLEEAIFDILVNNF